METLENKLNFTHSNDDMFFSLNTSMYETLKSGYNDKYEYIFPEITLNKNLLSSFTFGTIDFDSNLKVHNYDTNKTSKFLVNNFDWNSLNKNSISGLQTKLLGNFRNINYETKNINEYKSDTTNEFYGALGLLTKIDLYKKIENFSEHFLSPKILLDFLLVR